MTGRLVLDVAIGAAISLHVGAISLAARDASVVAWLGMLPGAITIGVVLGIASYVGRRLGSGFRGNGRKNFELHKRVSLIGLALFAEAVIVLSIAGAVVDKLPQFALIGLGAGFFVASVLWLGFAVNRRSMNERGYRW